MSIFDKIGHAVSSGLHTVTDGVSDAANSIDHQGQALAGAFESVGVTVGKGFMTGADWTGNELEKGAKGAGEGLVATGRYVSSHACDISVGSALAGVAAAFDADPEDDAAEAAIAVAVVALKEAGSSAAISTAVDALSKAMALPVYQIPGVNDVFSSSDSLADYISCVISTAIDANAAAVAESAGQYLQGVIISALTSAICDGEFVVGCAPS